MSTCPKRSVLNAGDRPAQVRRDALAVQNAVNAMQQRVLPHAGSTGRPTGMQAFGRPINHGTVGPMATPMDALSRAVGGLARSTANTLAPARGGVTSGPGVFGGGTPGSSVGPGASGFSNGRMIILAWGAPYTEPMEVLAPAGLRIAAIVAARIVDTSNPARYFRSGVSCDFVESGTPNRVTIRAIDGMTIGDPTVLQYTFIYFGA